MEEAKTKFDHKKESLTNKKNELLLNKTDIQKQLSAIDEDIEELKRTTNKD